MLCQRCGEKEATVHLTKIINGKKTEIFLCEDCAEETGQLSLSTGDPFSFHNLLADILNSGLESSVKESKKSLKCDQCGMAYEEFSKEGLFGCSKCYETFSDKIERLAKRIHGSSLHQGKVPKRRGGKLRIKKEIEELKEKMHKEVEKENFEKAAEIRDKIHDLEDKLGGEVGNE